MIYSQEQSRGLVVLTVDILNSRPTETPDNLANFMSTNNYTFPVLLDQNLTMTHRFGVSATPTNFIIDKNGVIQFRQTGQFSEATLNATISRLNGQ